MSTLDPHITAYVTGRRRRGEINANTAAQLRWRLASLSKAHGRRPLNQFGQATIERWQEATGHQRPASRRAYWSTARLFSAWLLAQQVITRDPFFGLRSPKEPTSVPRALTSEKIAALLSVVPDTRARAIVWLEVGLGLRNCEVAALQVEHWSRIDQVLTVTGKASHQRVLPVTVAVAYALDAYLSDAPSHYGPLIRSRDRMSGLSPAYIGSMMASWLREAGVKHAPYDGVSAHAMRHTAATDVLKRSRDPRAVQKMMGHSNLAVTERYLGLADMGTLREAMEGRDYRAAG